MRSLVNFDIKQTWSTAAINDALSDLNGRQQRFDRVSAYNIWTEVNLEWIIAIIAHSSSEIDDSIAVQT